jgi:ferritin-like protein
LVSGLEKWATDAKKEKTEIIELIAPRFEELEAKLFAEIKGLSDQGL